MKRDGRYQHKPGVGVVVTVDTILAPANSRGRVWTLSSHSTTAATATALLRNGTTAGGAIIARYDSPATIGDGGSVFFPNGVEFNAGLFADVAGGAPAISVCFSLDDRSDI